MPDRLILRELEASCRLGVTEQERGTPQPIWVDIECPIDAARAARSDALEDAVDYARLAAEVRGLLEARAFQLLETVAEAIAAMALKRCGAPAVMVRVKKRALAGLGYAAVEIERSVRPRRAPRPRLRARAIMGR
jgi:FolB domain-containing protein